MGWMGSYRDPTTEERLRNVEVLVDALCEYHPQMLDFEAPRVRKALDGLRRWPGNYRDVPPPTVGDRNGTEIKVGDVVLCVFNEHYYNVTEIKPDGTGVFYDTERGRVISHANTHDVILFCRPR
jgi:hypothetical protein